MSSRYDDFTIGGRYGKKESPNKFKCLVLTSNLCLPMAKLNTKNSTRGPLRSRLVQF